jgi:peptide/nickel transport system ATP-binding protein
MRAVDRRAFEVTDEATLREQFFGTEAPGGTARPSGEPARIVDDALAAVLEQRWEEAGEALVGAFAEPSICAKELPAYQLEPEHGTDSHFAACHLHRDTGRTVEGD